MFSQRNRELHKAIQQGDCAKVIQCLDKGPKRERADPNQVDSAGHLPLIRTVCNERLSDYTASRIAGALLDRGAYVDRRWRADNPTALYLACRENRFRTAELLLAHGAHVNFTEDEKHFTPLHIAMWYGSVDMVRLLLDHGADVKRRSRNGHKPLHVASCRGRVEIVELLFDRDLVDFYHSSSREGATALTLACREENIDVVRCLLARGVVVTYPSRAIAQSKPGIKALLDAAAPPEKRQLAHWINRIHLHAVGLRGDHQGSARHRLLNCRHLARHLVSFLLVK